MSEIPAQRHSDGSRKPREERWSEILQVATQLFYEKGYEATALQDIADRLGIMKGSLYYYIRTKENILFAVLDEIHKAGLANMIELASGSEPAIERLERMIVGHVSYIGAHLVETTVFLHEFKALPVAMHEKIIGTVPAYQKIFHDVFVDGQKDGTIRQDLDARLTAAIVLSSLNSTYRWLRPGDSAATKRVAQYFSTILIAGVKVQATTV